nr:uncharacterized protein LOC111424193 [Onthophagus taurus]
MGTSKNGVNAYNEVIRWSKNGKILDVGCGEGSTTVDFLYPLMIANFFKLQINRDGFTRRIWIKNIYDLMKRDGQTFFIIPANNPVFTAVMELRHEGNYIEYVKKVEHVFNTPFAQLSNPEDWIKPLMEKEGFKNVKCFKFPQDFTFESFDYLKRFIATFQFLIKEIPTDEQDDFIEQVGNRIIRISTFDETTQEIHASCFILAIIADK